MALRPLLNLNHIAVDPALVKRIPYGVALYYLALPLAYEENQASVVMTHPENQTALARLRDLLEADVVPVRGLPGEIRSLIQRFHPQHGLPLPKILAWSAQPAQAHRVAGLARLFGAATTSVSMLAAPGADLDEVLSTACVERCRLIVVRPPETVLADLLSRATTPLLLVRDDVRPLRRILIVMRGFSSDEYALDWVIPLIHHTGASVTLMPLAPSSNSLNQILNRNSLVREHVGGCLRRFQASGIHAHLKLRQGNPAQQIADEHEQGDYDLLVIPAEGYGEFIGSVLAEVDHRPQCAHRPVLVLKPTCT